MAVSRLAFLALVLAVAASRLIELRISRRRQRMLTSLGATPIGDRRFGLMVALHTAIVCGAAIEVFARHRPLVPALAVGMTIVFVAAETLRWWVIRTLGQHWNVQVMNSMHLGVVSTGPVPIRPSSELRRGVRRDDGAAGDPYGVGHGVSWGDCACVGVVTPCVAGGIDVAQQSRLSSRNGLEAAIRTDAWPPRAAVDSRRHCRIRCGKFHPC